MHNEMNPAVSNLPLEPVKRTRLELAPSRRVKARIRKNRPSTPQMIAATG
jgi:hypothetical protein